MQFVSNMIIDIRWYVGFILCHKSKSMLSNNRIYCFPKTCTLSIHRKTHEMKSLWSMLEFSECQLIQLEQTYMSSIPNLKDHHFFSWYCNLYLVLNHFHSLSTTPRKKLNILAPKLISSFWFHSKYCFFLRIFSREN